MTKTIAALIRDGAKRLEAADVPDPLRDAQLLMRWATGLGAAQLIAAAEEAVSKDQLAAFEDVITRRQLREPVSHITGRRSFWGHDFKVSSAVLDPRPETEVLVADALNRGPFERILDLGTGSGCILLSLLAAWPGAAGTGTDVSDEALSIAAANASEMELIERTSLVRQDWLEGHLPGAPFDLIVSNPPYISTDEMALLSPEVIEHEPHVALTPGGDGLDAYRKIAAGAANTLAPGGTLMLEIGPDQPHAVSAILANAGWNVLMIIPDLDQRPRVVVSQR
ncbi:MAG: peptide chain release factor N(5)-glutamine methyltransferase [Pseudomonadota bacterium]